jgi:histone H3/H4
MPPAPVQAFSAPTSSPYYPQPVKSEPSYHPSGAGYDPTGSMSRAPRGSRVKDEPASLSAPPAPTKAPPPSIDIRTKFPVARIKRIMQADEEVGKVAQVTPVAVNKALELFMTALVLGAADRAREKGGKRITAGHLKSVVEADEQFDFLTEIVGRVQDAAEGERKRKGGKESESEEENSGERKVKKGKGRRKKSDD